MAWYEILIVSVGLSLDVFTYALYKGAMLSKLDKKQILKMTLLFTGWQSGDLADRTGIPDAGSGRTQGGCICLEAAMCLGHAYQCGLFSVGNGHGIFRHRSNRTDHTAGDHGCVSRGYRYLCRIPDRMPREKPCADQWCDHLPVGRDRCVVPLLQLETGIFM